MQNKNEYKNIESCLKLILEGRRVDQENIRLGFIGLAKQNNELVDLNKKLNRKLDATLEEVYILKKER